MHTLEYMSINIDLGRLSTLCKMITASNDSMLNVMFIACFTYSYLLQIFMTFNLE